MDWFDLLQLTLVLPPYGHKCCQPDLYTLKACHIVSYRIFALNCDCSVSKNIRISPLMSSHPTVPPFFYFCFQNVLITNRYDGRDTIISMMTVLHYFEVIYSLRKLMNPCALLVFWLLLTIHLNSMRCNEPPINHHQPGYYF